MAGRPAKPADMSWVCTYLTVKDADASLAFYEKAFGFEKKMSMPGPGGKTGHAEMSWRGNVIMFSPEGMGPCQAPVTTGARPPFTIYVYCDDVDALFKRATAAGAKVEQAPQDMFWGDRMCHLADPDGYLWNFATNVGDFDPSKIPQQA